MNSQLLAVYSKIEPREVSTVIGKGNDEEPLLMIVGEAPGREEENSGQPFVGPAGRLLHEILQQVGADESKIFFDNVVRHWPRKLQGNQWVTIEPTKTEVLRDLPILYEVLKHLKSKPLIVALGNNALEALVGKRSITRNAGVPMNLLVPKPLRGTWDFMELEGYGVIGCIHPSAILRSGDQAKSQYATKVVEHLRYSWLKASGQVVNYWKDYTLVTDPNQFTDWVDDVLANKRDQLIALDYETTSLSPYGDSRIVAAALCAEPGKAIVVPFFHATCPWNEDSITQTKLRHDLKRLLDTVDICMWNGSFDIKWTRLKFGLDVTHFEFDGMLARHWLNAGLGKSLKLDDVAADEYQFHGHGVGLEKGNLFNANPDTLLRYAGGDADATMRECRKLRADWQAKAEQQPAWRAMYESFYEIMVRGTKIVIELEMAGVKISETTNRTLNEQFPREMEELYTRVRNSKYGTKTAQFLTERVKPKLTRDKQPVMTNEGVQVMEPCPLEFNLASTVTLQHLLYTSMKLPKYIDPETDDPTLSACKEALEQHEEHCLTYINKNTAATRETWENKLQALRDLRAWRKAKDEWSRYVQPVVDLVDDSGLIHPDYNIAGTVTGRFSSWFHGFPKKSKTKLQFVTRWPRGGTILQADMAAAEMRVLASLSRDQGLIATIKSGVDIHTANACKMFNLDISKVTKKERDVAKRLGFGIVFGIGDDKLANQLECTVEQARKYKGDWYTAYPGTREWVARIYGGCKQRGYVMTNFGRIRHLPEIKSSREGDRAWIQSYNSIIQSCASDLTYAAVRAAWRRMQELGLRSLLFGFIHDAVVVDVFPGEQLIVASILKWALEDCNNERSWILAPMKADFEINPNWGMMCGLSWKYEKDAAVMTMTGTEGSITRLQMSLKHVPEFVQREVIETEEDDKTGERQLALTIEVPHSQANQTAALAQAVA